MRTPELVTALLAEFDVGDEFEKKEYICSDVGDCGWRGLGTETNLVFIRNTAWSQCPKCSSNVAYIVDIDAENHRASYVSRKHRDYIEKLKETLTQDEASFPELEGDSLEFSWTIEPSDSADGVAPDYVVIDCDDVVIHREEAYWGNKDRFEQVEEMLRRRYGSRFSDLEHFDAFGYLNGRPGVVWR